MRVLVLLAALTVSAQAQWTIQTPTTADLRGIDNVGKGIAWASGSNGTVLRTEDGGYLWQRCTIPPNAEHLDFRGIQAFDANTAIVMSSGPGDQSRLYKTTDGCQTWTLVLTNPDKEGFWDALVANDGVAFLVGDPVSNRFVIYASTDGKFERWTRFGEHSSLHEFKFDISPYKGEGLFAASNSNLLGNPSSGIMFVTGGTLGAFLASATWSEHGIGGYDTFSSFKSHLPLAAGVGGGAFSIASAGQPRQVFQHSHEILIAVGGDYLKPDDIAGTAAISRDGGKTWIPSITPPHGFRSAVAYDAPTKTWITVGPNGTDISTDDGRNWRPLHPTNNDAPDADQHWNALSLPYVVGPHGRIGILNPSALQTPPTKP